MEALVSKHAPRAIADFVGLAAPKAMFSRLVEAPYQSAWLSLGNPGTGKSNMAFTVARALNAAIHHVPARRCDLEEVELICRKCAGYPMLGDRWAVIIDEVDQVTGPAQLAMLSVLDGTAGLQDVIFLMTCNSTDKLQERFLGRVRTLRFDAPTPEEITAYLRKVWRAEKGGKAPDFLAIARDRPDVRSALMTLETELLVPGSFVPAPPNIRVIPAANRVAKSSNNHAEHNEISELRQRKSEAARRAWANSPKLQMRKRA